MRKSGIKLFGDLISTITIAVLFVVILFLVVFSAFSYQRAVESSDNNGNTRAVLSYVITAVKANEASRVSIEEQEGMQVLVIEDAETGYGQEIFWKDGAIREAYGKIGQPVDTEDALEIGAAERFELNWLADQLLEIRTELGNSYVHIR